jgi:hypothetical protein
MGVSRGKKMVVIKVDIDEFCLEDNGRLIINTSLWDKDANNGTGGYRFVKLSIRRVTRSSLHIAFEDGLSGKHFTDEMFKKLIFIH